MMQFSVRLVLIAFSTALMLHFGDRSVHAQSSPQIEVPPDATPAPNDSVPSPGTPSDETSGEPPQRRQPRRFVGVGGIIGVDGEDIGLSEGGFTVMTRNDLNDRLSIRGLTVFGSDRTDNTIALTVNFPIRSRSGAVKLSPFVGGGALISSTSLFENMIVRGLVTGGIDVPLSRRFVATTSVNVGFTDTTNVGVGLGLMYGF
jgi:hypothetical protein